MGFLWASWSRPLVFFGAASANPEADGRRGLAPPNGDRPSYSGSAQLGSALDSLSLANCPLPTSFFGQSKFFMLNYSGMFRLELYIFKGWSAVGKIPTSVKKWPGGRQHHPEYVSPLNFNIKMWHRLGQAHTHRLTYIYCICWRTKGNANNDSAQQLPSCLCICYEEQRTMLHLPCLTSPPAVSDGLASCMLKITSLSLPLWLQLQWIRNTDDCIHFHNNAGFLYILHSDHRHYIARKGLKYIQATSIRARQQASVSEIQIRPRVKQTRPAICRYSDADFCDKFTLLDNLDHRHYCKRRLLRASNKHLWQRYRSDRE